MMGMVWLWAIVGFSLRRAFPKTHRAIKAAQKRVAASKAIGRLS